MSREAMKLALEALEAHADIGIKSDKAITALREALAEQPAQQEPVAIALNTGTKQGVKWLKNVEHGEHLYTSPLAQRTWVSLTPEELDEMFSKTLKNKKLVNWVARAIEAKLRSKNEDRN